MTPFKKGVLSKREGKMVSGSFLNCTDRVNVASSSTYLLPLPPLSSIAMSRTLFLFLHVSPSSSFHKLRHTPPIVSLKRPHVCMTSQLRHHILCCGVSVFSGWSEIDMHLYICNQTKEQTSYHTFDCVVVQTHTYSNTPFSSRSWS